MNDVLDTEAPTPTCDAAVWIHDLRNAVNAVSIALHAADAMLQRDDRERAAQNVLRAQEACDRLLALIRTGAPGTGDGAPPGGGGNRTR